MKKIYIIATALVLAGSVVTAKSQATSNKTEIAQSLNVFNALFKELQMNYVDTINAKRSIRTAIDAMLSQIDPYTEYYPLDEQDAFRSISTGEYAGIGSIIMQREGHVVLSEPQWDSPAMRAGVRHGDILIAIDGDTLPSTYTTAEASSRLKGQAGTKVRLTVQRPYAVDSIIDIEVTRGLIKTDPVPASGMLRDGVGYIRLTTFNEKSAERVKQALTELMKQPDFRSLVLDLRDNGGGLLESAVQIASLFVPKGTEIVTTRYRDKKNEKTYKTTQAPIAAKVPLAVLINDYTASASEILSGSLQDLDRAVILGERSYGKGLVQSSRPLPYDGLLKVTVGRYYLPSGRLVQAIDYSHRNPDGSVARIPDSLTNVFHTVAGREVRDGGGITPDIKVKHKQGNRLLYKVVADLWSYDYATRFAARHGEKMPVDPTEFAINDSIFEDFKAFIDPERFKYDSMSSSGIKMLREYAESDGYMNDSVAAEFDRLESMLHHDLSHDLDFNRDELIRILDEEIVRRFYDTRTQTLRQLDTDEDVNAAIDVLIDPTRYRELLAAPAKTSKN